MKNIIVIILFFLTPLIVFAQELEVLENINLITDLPEKLNGLYNVEDFKRIILEEYEDEQNQHAYPSFSSSSSALSKIDNTHLTYYGQLLNNKIDKLSIYINLAKDGSGIIFNVFEESFSPKYYDNWYSDFFVSEKHNYSPAPTINTAFTVQGKCQLINIWNSEVIRTVSESDRSLAKAISDLKVYYLYHFFKKDGTGLVFVFYNINNNLNNHPRLNEIVYIDEEGREIRIQISGIENDSQIKLPSRINEITEEKTTTDLIYKFFEYDKY